MYILLDGCLLAQAELSGTEFSQTSHISVLAEFGFTDAALAAQHAYTLQHLNLGGTAGTDNA